MTQQGQQEKTKQIWPTGRCKRAAMGTADMWMVKEKEMGKWRGVRRREAIGWACAMCTRMGLCPLISAKNGWSLREKPYTNGNPLYTPMQPALAADMPGPLHLTRKLHPAATIPSDLCLPPPNPTQGLEVALQAAGQVALHVCMLVCCAAPAFCKRITGSAMMVTANTQKQGRKKV